MSTAKMRSIRVRDEDWEEIGRRAEASGEKVTAYIIRRCLEPDRVGPLLGVLRKIGKLALGAVKGHRSGSSD